jgi:hypothetical protein
MIIINALKATAAVWQLWRYEQAHQVCDVSPATLANCWRNYYDSL